MNKHHKARMFKKDWTASSDFMNYSTLNSEHNWEDLLYTKELINMHFQKL